MKTRKQSHHNFHAKQEEAQGTNKLGGELLEGPGERPMKMDCALPGWAGRTPLGRESGRWGRVIEWIRAEDTGSERSEAGDNVREVGHRSPR